jgi:hypothetical protein
MLYVIEMVRHQSHDASLYPSGQKHCAKSSSIILHLSELSSGEDNVLPAPLNFPCLGNWIERTIMKISLKQGKQLQIQDCIWRVFQKEFYKFESLYKFIQRICTGL